MTAASASAGIMINFNINAKPYTPATPDVYGNITYDGSGGALTGTNVVVDSVTGIATPFNSGINFACAGCFLNFTSGANISEPVSSPATWTFAGGSTNSFQVFGAVPNAGITTTSLLLSGSLQAVTLTKLSTHSDFAIMISPIIDSKHPLLLDFFLGPGASAYYPVLSGTYTQVFGGFADAPTFRIDSQRIMAGTITNNVVPEPGSVILLSTAAAILLFLVYRQRRQLNL